MAKSSRGRGRKSSRKVDWVVNDETYGLGVSLPNATQGFVALTLPEAYGAYVDPTLAVAHPRHQFPEQAGGQVAYAVRGQYFVAPSVWAVGSSLRLACRIVKKPIELQNGVPVAITDPNYSLFLPAWANERFLWQHMHQEQFALGQVIEGKAVDWKGVCKMEPDEALWMFFENQSGITITLSINVFMRTLMRANG